MTLTGIYKGMLLSEGFVTTPERLRAVSPEALPQAPPARRTEADGPPTLARANATCCGVAS